MNDVHGVGVKRINLEENFFDKWRKKIWTGNQVKNGIFDLLRRKYAKIEVDS